MKHRETPNVTGANAPSGASISSSSLGVPMRIPVHAFYLLLVVLTLSGCGTKQSQAAKQRQTDVPTSPPTFIRSDVEGATRLLDSKHESVPLWPSALTPGTTLRCPSPIDSVDDLKAVLTTAPNTFHRGFHFAGVFELDGWLAASLEPPSTPPGQSNWVFGVLIKKGSTELCPFSHW
jgi:hypothetical protein